MDSQQLKESNSRPSISLVLPAYNEQEVIGQAIQEAVSALSPLTERYEVIVVDDGSTDDTARRVLEFAAENPSVRLVKHSPNRGYGAAILSGFQAASLPLIVFTDSDCQFDLTEMDRFVLLAERYEVVCGYRIDRKDTALRCLYSKGYNLLVRGLLGSKLRDIDCAFKMFHAEVAKQLELKGNGFLVNSELLTQVRKMGCRVVEVGVSHRPRELGSSTVSIGHIPKVFHELLRYWWNEIQFPGPAQLNDSLRVFPHQQCQDISWGQDLEVAMTGGSMVAKSPSKVSQLLRNIATWFSDHRIPIALLLVAAVFLFSNLSYPLIDRDETRYAEIPREMILTGNWILPQLNFEPYYDKPPLVYWLCALSYKMFGVSEASARLIPATAAFLMLLATVVFCSRNFGRQVGNWALIALMLCAGFAFTSRYLLLDGVLSLLVAASWFLSFEALRRDRISDNSPSERSGQKNLSIGSPWWILSAACVGFGFLTKGPISLVLCVPPVAAYSFLSDQSKRVRVINWGIFSAVVFAIAAPWFFLVHQQDSNFLIEFFYRHNVSRFAGEFHAKPWWYFIPVALIAGHPWTFLTLPYLKFLGSRSEAMQCERPQTLGYLLLCGIWTFVFFSASKCKLPTYLLPTAPVFAIAVGYYLEMVQRRTDWMSVQSMNRLASRLSVITTCAAAIGLILFTLSLGGIASISMAAFSLFWTLLLIGSLLLFREREKIRYYWISPILLSALFSGMVLHQLVPIYSKSEALFDDSNALTRQIANDQATQVVTFDHEFSGVPFYLNRNDVIHFKAGEIDALRNLVTSHQSFILVVKKQVQMSDLLGESPASVHMREIASTGPGKVYHLASENRIATVPGSMVNTTH